MYLTEEKRKLGRRNFIKAVAATPVAGALVWKASGMTPVRAAIIGPGGEGRVLMENASPSHIRLVAVCDIFPDNLERGLQIARKLHDPSPEGYNDYRRILERRDIEAVHYRHSAVDARGDDGGGTTGGQARAVRENHGLECGGLP